MKKSDKQPPASGVQPPAEVTAPPINENTLPANPAREGEQPPAEVTAPPINESTSPAATPAPNTPPVETVSAPPISGEETKISDAQPILTNPAPLPPPGKGSRTLQDYMKLDWTKTNADLAKECNVSRQAIAQMRRKVEETKATGGLPTFADVTKPETTAVQQVVDYDVMAAMVFDMSAGILTTTLGPEWQPSEPKEREGVCLALKVYFQSKQVQDLPPGLMLTAVILAYSAPRLRAPNTSSKLKMAWTWMKLKLSKFRKKKD